MMNAKVISLLNKTAEDFRELAREMLTAGENESAGACFVAQHKLLTLQYFGREPQASMPFAAEGQPFDKPKKERKPRAPKKDAKPNGEAVEAKADLPQEAKQAIAVVQANGPAAKTSATTT